MKRLAQSHERNLLELGLNERFQSPSVIFRSLGFTLFNTFVVLKELKS